MCGIAGIVALDGQALPEPDIAAGMCRLMVHRGPDEQGIHATPRAQIGMRRLSIIDLAGGSQPLHNEDRSIWLVFNGEIYNYRELRRELERLGHAFYTDSDGECIVHAYEQYGDDCFTRLRGMFAIALLDQRRGRLLLARDRLGKKPLYYTSVGGRYLAFASELKCLFAIPGFDPGISPTATREYFALGYVPWPDSIYEGVSKLPPAHYLALEGGAPIVRRYWQLGFAPKWKGDETELGQRLLEHLDEAVHIRLASDVPFGAFLSGGLDSSLVAALMARHLTAPVKTFTIGFQERAFDEIPDARRVARHIGADHHELVVTPDAVEMLQELAWHFDEPFGDPSSIPTFLVSRLAKGHVKMVLSGDGGDENFAGYERYHRYGRLDSLARLPLGLARGSLALGSAVCGGALGSRLGRIADRMAEPYPERYLSGVALSTAADAAAVLLPEVAHLDPYARVRPRFLRTDIDLEMERILAGDMETYLADDILVKVDRMSMANSIEARAPLLDHVLVEFCARLPYRLKSDGRSGKRLLKQVAAGLLPPECLQKRKQGFGVPLAQWFRRELKPLMFDLLADRSFHERGIFDVRGIRACFEEHQAGRRDWSEMLWLVLNYEMWAREFVDRRPARSQPRLSLVVHAS